MTAEPGTDPMSLLEWRRTIGDLYAEIRATPDRQLGWQQWRQTRDRLFRGHPQSPIPACDRAGYRGPHLYSYDPAWRLAAAVEPAAPASVEIATSTTDIMTLLRFGQVCFTFAGTAMSLELYWLTGYGGGLFLPFADATSGTETYGAGRYLLDTVKGADLGQEEGLLVLDFNFAYFPSCAYDPRWTCPLALAANRLSVPVRAGERLSQQ
ncbi:MAG TPA: DUF1684 domain-containing protein [Solirubrobacteraceae bacterium]|nr:DUF1684 domain-containing protein [Solirubrobacteraceae bacterium]